MTEVSIIIPSWERRNDILLTLENLRKQTYPRCEVIVVDQASTDGGPEEIERRFPEVKLIRLSRNIGPGAARNLGSEKASGEILVFLDNDDDLEETALERVAERFRTDVELGIAGFKILNFYTREIDLMSWSYQKSRLKDTEKEFETYIFCGGGYAMPKAVFQKGARYWEEIFWHSEEKELALRVLKMGYKIIYYPKAVVYHRASLEKRPVYGKRNFQGFRNFLWITWKYYPFWAAVRTTFLSTGAYFVKGLRNGYALWILRAFFSSFRRTPILFTAKDKLDAAAWKRYKKLSDKGSWRSVLKQILNGK